MPFTPAAATLPIAKVSNTPTTSGFTPANANLPITNTTSQEPTAQKNSFSPSGQSAKALPILLAGAKAFGNAVTSGEQNVGKIISAPHDVKVEAGVEKTLSDAQYNTEKSLTDQIAAYKAAGKDTTHLEQTLAGVRQNDISKQHGDVTENVPASQETPEQALGAVGGTALDVLTAGTYGAAAEAAKTGELASKAAPSVASAVADTVTKPSSIATKIGNVAKGAGIGYTADVANNAQDNAQGSDILKPHAGTALGAAIPIVGETIGGIKNALKSNPQKDLQTVIDATRDPVETKRQTLASNKAGNGDVSGPLNTRVQNPTEKDVTRANNVKPYFDVKANADTNNANLRAGVTHISNTKMAPLLAENPNHIQWNHLNDFISNNSNDPKRIMSLPAFQDKGVGGVSTNDVLEARKQLDTMIYGEQDATLPHTPERAAVDQKAQADRNALNKLNEEMLSTGGNVEGLNTIHSLKSAASERGIKINSAANDDLEKHYGVTRTPENQQKATQFRSILNQQHSLYEAQNNLARNSYEKKGTNAFGRFKKNNPVTAAIAKKLPYVAGALGLGYEAFK